MPEDRPDYIAPEKQNLTLTDITSEWLHSSGCTVSIGKGDAYLSEAKEFPKEWPAAGVTMGFNSRPMISLPVRRARSDRGHKARNIFFVVVTSSPCSYLSQEAMKALIGDNNFDPGELNVVVQDESFQTVFHKSPPGKFRDSNVLGMDFLKNAKVSMTMDAPIHRFRLFKQDHKTMDADYTDEDYEGM